SHDSGTYALSTRNGVAPDRPHLQSSVWVKLFGFIVLPIMKRWTKTQNLNITEQLINGIRYFDLRVATKERDNNLYFVHGLYANEIESICDEICSFLNTHTKEIVIIDFQHFYSVSEEQHMQLIDNLMNIFGRKVCPFDAVESVNQLTLEYMWRNSYQVLIFYRQDQMRSYNPKLWPSRKLPNPWANTIDKRYLIEFLDENVKRRDETAFYVTQGVLTPNNKCVILHCFSSLHTHLATDCNDTINCWLITQRIGPKGPNVVMCDFIEWNESRIPQTVVKLNYS
ncbi:PI-PLC X domain-containing protein 3-like protein, partial [Leptotrombidium deliense]